eukprot:scaffold2213_cov143-Isochrysis_galbana.AAC.3
MREGHPRDKHACTPDPRQTDCVRSPRTAMLGSPPRDRLATAARSSICVGCSFSDSPWEFPLVAIPRSPNSTWTPMPRMAEGKSRARIRPR